MTAPAPSSTQSQGLLHPLQLFRERDGQPLPVIEPLGGVEMPEPYRSLLVHEGDMTSRLESFHESRMGLRALHVEALPHVYRREVLLLKASDGKPVEYGAIEILLDAFPEALRSEIVLARKPLGGLLNESGMEYHGEPRGFFRVQPDATLSRHFEIREGVSFYGRSNRLVDSAGRTLARIVEVLPP